MKKCHLIICVLIFLNVGCSQRDPSGTISGNEGELSNRAKRGIYLSAIQMEDLALEIAKLRIPDDLTAQNELVNTISEREHQILRGNYAVNEEEFHSIMGKYLSDRETLDELAARRRVAEKQYPINKASNHGLESTGAPAAAESPETHP